MAKSMRSKIKKKWRAVKRDKLEDFHKKKLEELNQKLREIAQTPVTKSDVDIKTEPIDVDPLESMRLEKPKAKKAVITVEMDAETPAPAAPTPAPAASSSSSSKPAAEAPSTRRGRSAMRQ